MKTLSTGVLVLLLVACGDERTRFVTDSGTSPPDTGSGDGAPASDSGAPPRDSSSPDADSSSPSDACVPTMGTEAHAGSCQQLVISVLRSAGAPTAVEVRGLLSSIGDGCRTVEGVELIRGTETVQSLSALPAGSTSRSFVARAEEAAPALTAFCESDDGRYDPVEIVVRGRVDGGSYTARCGAASGGAWPPSAVLTCHENLPIGPNYYGSAEIEAIEGMWWSTIWLSYQNERDIALESVDSNVTLVPTGDPFGGAFFEPVVTSGWDPSVGFASTAERVFSIQLNQLADPLGAELCPLPDPGDDPPFVTRPAFLIKLSGTTSRGPFRSEAFIPECYRYPSP